MACVKSQTRRCKTAGHQPRGFTLLELLIVVIVIGIMAAVILPQTQKMADEARAAEAKNSLGVIMTAEWIYFQQHNTFSGDLGELMANVNPSHYRFFASHSSSNGATWKAHGVVGTSFEGINLWGFIADDGFRYIGYGDLSTLEMARHAARGRVGDP